MPHHAFARCLILSLACGLAWPWAASAQPQPITWSDAQAQAAGLATEVLHSTGGDSGLVLQGTVVLPMQATEVVSTPVAGVVQSVLVNPAQALRAGQALAVLQSPQLLEWQRDWLQAEAQSQLADAKLQRDEQLFAEGVIAEMRVRESRTQARLARLSLDEKRLALRLAGHEPRANRTDLSAGLSVPTRVAGTVMELLVAPGQRLEAGAPLAKLARDGVLAIELQASAAQAAALRVGDLLQPEGCRTPARLVALAPQLNSSTQSISLRAEWQRPAGQAEPCLRPNQFVQVSLLRRADPAGGLTVPAAAVVRQAGQAHVFVKRQGQYLPTPVTLGPAGGQRLPVLQGLKAGDEVVVRGTAALKGAWLGLGSEAETAPAAPPPASQPKASAAKGA